MSKELSKKIKELEDKIQNEKEEKEAIVFFIFLVIFVVVIAWAVTNIAGPSVRYIYLR